MFIHWDASDDKKIYEYNYQATKESIQRALAGKPSVQDAISGSKTAKHPQPQITARRADLKRSARLQPDPSIKGT
jgi:formaldehyde-activating enzyme involved in methanogenesis